MKILFLISGVGPPAGWGTEFIQNLIFQLSDKGVEATILTPIYSHTHPQWRTWIKEVERKYNLKVYTFSLPGFIQKNLILYLGLVPILTTIYTIKLFKKKEFDLIHEFSSTPIILFRALFFKIFFKIPVVYTHSVFNNTILGKLLWFKIFDFARYYLIPSKKMVLKLQKIGIDSEKIFYSPPGLDINSYLHINKTKSRQILGLPKKKFIFSYFGPLTEEKGIFDLVKAAKKIDQKIKDQICITLYTVWKGSSQHQQIKEYIESLKMDHVILKEEYVNIPTLLSASDFIILPQRTGHGTTIPPISVIEALAAHRPVIATSIIGNNELISEKLGILIKPHSYSDITKAIRQILNLRFEAEDFDQALGDFELDKAVDLHLEVYHQAIIN